VSVRGEVPPDIVERVSAVHARLLAHITDQREEQKETPAKMATETGVRVRPSRATSRDVSR
jgi:hypothetical protein